MDCCTSCAPELVSCMLTGNLRIYVTGLTNAQDYWWVITDAHGNRYQKQFTYVAADGYFEIDVTTDIPAGLLNENAGQFRLHIQSSATSLGSVPFGFKQSIDCIEFQAKCSDYFTKEQLGIE